MPAGIAMLQRAAQRFPWDQMQTVFPFSEDGLHEATQAAMAMRCIKATVVPIQELD